MLETVKYRGNSVLARRLKEARLRLGVSQEKLGRLAGIDESSASARMNQYERGKHSPDFSLMQRLARILNMPVSWFYTDDDDMARMLEIFFRLDAGDRKRLLALAEALQAHKAQEPPPCTADAAPPLLRA